MLTHAQLARLRGVAEAAMVDDCLVQRPAATQGAIDPVTLKRAGVAPTDIYGHTGPGRCEIERPGGVAPPEYLLAGGEHVAYDVIVKLPAADQDAVEVRRGDVITLRGCAHTPALVGRAFTVKAVADSTWSTKRRLLCTEGV